MSAKDPKVAKAGEQLSAKAASKLRRLNNVFEHLLTDKASCAIRPKSDAVNGQWVCADCGAVFQNNMMAQNHPLSHRRVWWTGLQFEAP